MHNKWCGALFVASLLFIWCSNATITDVHIVTMNHLDVGYAQLAYVIINEYFDTYFPNAAITAQQLRNNGTERLIYTCHSWLIDIYVNCPKYAALKALPPGPIHCPNASALALVTKAIEQGDITWHGFPFNSQLEFAMNPDFLAAGIATTQFLDDQFGFPHKITISQRDVPGTTRSVIPIFIQQGIQAFTVGVNEAAAPPAVPKIFTWLDPVSNQSIIAMWHPGGYGGDTLVDCVYYGNITHALCWDFRTDNSGPPAIPEVQRTYETVRSEFPGANVYASTYDAFVESILPFKDQLPVLTGEIGDTWIYGVGSDPLKAAYTREIIRARTECVASKACDTTTFNFHAFDMMLIKNTEHTWSIDVMMWLNDTVNWTNEQFNKVVNQPDFQLMIFSWNEQRGYLESALNALGDSYFQSELLKRIAPLGDPVIDLSDYAKVDPGKNYSCGRFDIAFDTASGAINYLMDKDTQYLWATDKYPLAQFLYQSYSQDDYQTFLSEYITEQPLPSWVKIDFGKPNMTGTHSEVLPSLQALYYKEDKTNYYFYAHLSMPSDAYTLAGAPQSVYVNIIIPTNSSTIEVNVIWQNKTATRLAEAVFTSFIPNWEEGTTYQFNKLGEWIGVEEVMLNGSKHLHVLQQGARYNNGERSLLVASLDAAIVCIGTPTAFSTPLVSFPDPSQGSHFILYDNIWGTNFIQWYPYEAEDWQQIFRFQLSFQ